jgi:hypothetical protein
VKKPEMKRVQERRKARKLVWGKKVRVHEGGELSALAVKARQV